MKDRKRYRLQLNLIAIGLPESAISKHQDDCPCWYAAHAKSLTESKRHIRPHPIIPSPCARRGEGAAEQPQKINIIVDTPPTRVHGDTVYTPNRVYSVHVNTTPYSVHGDTRQCYSTAPKVRHGLVEMMRGQIRPASNETEQPQKVSNIVDTTRTRVHGDDGKNGKRFLAAIRFGMTISLRDEKSHRKNAGDSCRCKIAYGQYKIDIATITKST